MGGRRGKLLLVEDENLLRGLIAQFLRAEGFEVIEAADGLEGVSLYASQGPFDLVLLDLNLPMLSGVDVCRRIKDQRPHQPVLIGSAAILDSHIIALHALNVDQFLTKPYHPLELLERIARELARDDRLKPGEAAPPIPASLWQVAPAHPSIPSAWSMTQTERSKAAYAATACPR